MNKQTEVQVPTDEEELQLGLRRLTVACAQLISAASGFRAVEGINRGTLVRKVRQGQEYIGDLAGLLTDPATTLGRPQETPEIDRSRGTFDAIKRVTRDLEMAKKGRNGDKASAA